MHMKLDLNKGKKRTEPDFSGKNPVWLNFRILWLKIAKNEVFRNLTKIRPNTLYFNVLKMKELIDQEPVTI